MSPRHQSTAAVSQAGHGNDRKQFGKSISSFQAVQFELADMAMKVEAARLLVYTAAARAQRGEPGLGFISAAAKCFASDVAMDVTESAVQLFGGAGYTRDFPVERMMRDAKITQIYEGTNQIQHIVMSRAILAAPEPQRFAADRPNFRAERQRPHQGSRCREPCRD